MIFKYCIGLTITTPCVIIVLAYTSMYQVPLEMMFWIFEYPTLIYIAFLKYLHHEVKNIRILLNNYDGGHGNSEYGFCASAFGHAARSLLLLELELYHVVVCLFVCLFACKGSFVIDSFRTSLQGS